jgi:hypothetical protein
MLQPIRIAARMRLLAGSLLVGSLLATSVFAACNRVEGVPAVERRAIADSLAALVEAAYDFSRADAPASLLSLYPDSGRVISAAAGQALTTRDSLSGAIRGFWERVGQNMREPRFVLGSTWVDVITRDAAVMTLTYSIPHRTPAGNPHLVSGAWTMFWRRLDGRWVIVQEHLSDTPESTQSSVPDTSQTSGMADTASSATGTMHRH